MSPRQQIANLYWRYPQPRTFDTDEYLYRRNGHVIETPDVFVMGKGVQMAAPIEDVLNPAITFARHLHDAWFIHAMAGNLRSMHKVMPYHLPYIGWARRSGAVRWHWLEDAHHMIDILVPNPKHYSILTPP